MSTVLDALEKCTLGTDCESCPYYSLKLVPDAACIKALHSDAAALIDTQAKEIAMQSNLLGKAVHANAVLEHKCKKLAKKLK